MTEKLKIRFANQTDAETLSHIGRLSFHQAFAEHPANHPDDMKIYMDEAFSVTTISQDLNAEDVVYLLAEIEDTAVGYAKLKTDYAEEIVSGKKPLELCRLYCLQEFIGHGIGKALMLKCLEFAQENSFDVIWLGVWEFNFQAQKFYAKFGFEKIGEHVFQLGNDPQTDWVLQKHLS